MGNFMNIVLCKGNENGAKLSRQQRIFYEGYRESTENQAVKKKYLLLKTNHTKMMEEKKLLTTKCGQQSTIIDQMKEALEARKLELEERISELGSKSEKLEEMREKVDLFDLMKEKLAKMEGKNEKLEILEQKILEFRLSQEQIIAQMKEMEDERDDLIADNDALESDIGLLEVENEEMKKLLRKALNERSVPKKKMEVSRVSRVINSPGQIRN